MFYINILFLLLSGCTYYGLFGGLSGTSAIMSIAMMSIERHACVARPLDPSSRMTRSRALCMVGFIWTYSSIFSFMPIFGLNEYVPEGFLTSCSFNYLSDELRDRVFIMSFFVAAWCVPMIIVCRCYIGIVISVSETQRLFLNHAQSLQEKIGRDRNIENKRRLEIKLAKISFFLISIWTVSWTPYAIIALLGVFTDRSMLTPMMSMLPALLCKMACVLDPFVYGLSNRQFKSELVKRLVALCKSKKIRQRNVTSFLMRTMSGKSRDISITDENADFSLSYEGQQETTKGRDMNMHDVAKSMQPECDIVGEKHKKTESATHNLPEDKNDSNSHRNSNDSEFNNNVGLMRIRVFPIPQIYVIERYDDIIKLKSRRSF